MSSREWLRLMQEDVLEPDIAIVDAHHHIWEKARVAEIEDYGREAFFADKAASGHRILATVPVDCRMHYRTTGPDRLRVVGETEYMNEIAEEGFRRRGAYAGACSAIVPTADLLMGAEVGEILDAHLQASPRVRGIRFITAFDESLPQAAGDRIACMMMRPEFREGMAELLKRHLSFDAYILQTQIHELEALARAFPETTLILNHLGGPFALGRYAGRPAEAFNDWKRAMKTLVPHPNVVVKIGGLNMAMTGLSAAGLPRPRSSIETALIQRDYILTAIDMFGPARCMFTSNFPIDMSNISWNVLWNAFKLVTAGFSARERTDMFSEVALRIYRIARRDTTDGYVPFQPLHN